MVIRILSGMRKEADSRKDSKISYSFLKFLVGIPECILNSFDFH